MKRRSPRGFWEEESDSSLPSLRRTRKHSLAVANVSCSKQSSCSFDNNGTLIVDSKRPKKLPHSCLASASVRPQRARRRPQAKAARGGRFYNMHQRWVCVALLLLLSLPVACVGQQDQIDNESIPWHCGCQTCTQSVWERHAGNSTCGALIRQATTPDLSREKACTRIATEFAECAPCSNLGCNVPAPVFVLAGNVEPRWPRKRTKTPPTRLLQRTRMTRRRSRAEIRLRKCCGTIPS